MKQKRSDDESIKKSANIPFPGPEEIQYKSIVRAAMDGFWIADSTGRLLDINDAYCRMTGYSRDELLKMRVTDIEAAETSEETAGHIRRIKEAGSDRFITRHRCKDGRVIDLEVSVNYMPELERFSVFVRDITERKKEEEALRRIEWLVKERTGPGNGGKYHPSYGDLVSLNKGGVLLNLVGKDVLRGIVYDYLDLLETSSAVYEKNGDYALGIFSSGWCQLLDEASRKLCDTGDNREALASGKWLCHESCWTEASRRSVETGEIVDVECDGGIRLYAVPIRAGEEIIGSINFGYGDPPRDPVRLREIAGRFRVDINDLKRCADAYLSRPSFIIDIAKDRLKTSAKLIGKIVELKLAEDVRARMESELRKHRDHLEELVKERTVEIAHLNEKLVGLAEEALQASRAKSDFIANMSHELRTPLNSVLGFAQVLQAEYFGALNAKQQEYLTDILQSGEHLLSLIGDILDLSKVEAGKMELSLTMINLRGIFDNALTLLSSTAKERAMRFTTRIGPGLPAEIVCDSRKIKQVLYNLFSNALKFSPCGGDVILEAKMISADEIEISVSDDGPGIKEEDREKIFSPFVRLEHKKAGTGLGLSLSKRMVELWGGRIGVVSPPEGKKTGCRFYFTVPVVRV